MKRSHFTSDLLHPRCWLTWFGFGLWWLVVQVLPYRVQMLLGAGLGILAGKLNKRRRIIASRNIEQCFPELSAAEQQRILRKSLANVGCALFESGIAWFWPRWRLRRLCVLEGIEHLDKAQEQGKGVLLLCFHYTCLDLCAVFLSTCRSVDAFYRPHGNPVYEYLQRRGRERFSAEGLTIPRDDMRTTIRHLKKGRAIIYLPDQDYGRKHSVFVPFFGTPAASLTATSQLVRMTGAAAIPCITCRRVYGRYHIKVHPPLVVSGESSEADALLVNQFLEEQLRHHPEQYLWVHRRFKTRPEGEPDIYNIDDLLERSRKRRVRRAAKRSNKG